MRAAISATEHSCRDSRRSSRAFPPREKPEGAVPKDTKIVVYNGAETKMESTIAYLEDRFEVTATLADDPTIRADIVITIGKGTPDLEAPPSS